MDQGAEVYPATYRAPMISRFKPALIVGSLYILAMFGKAHLNTGSSIWFWLTSLLVFLLIEAVALNIGSCRVILYSDRIEKKSLLSVKSMRRGEIGKIVERDSGLIMLTYKYNSTDGMMLPKGIGGDAAWNAWMDTTKRI